MPTYEGFRLKILEIRRKAFAKQRRKHIIDPSFTIISNNCWGGMIYESYDLPKESPTVGLFFMASDYIKFLSNLQGYLNNQLSFIDPQDSKWKNQVCSDKRFGHYPVGVLNDGINGPIEIFFLHYKNEEEARDKWTRRIQRINWNRLLIKYNDQNGCDIADVEAFLNLPYKNKIFFTCKNWPLENQWEYISTGLSSVIKSKNRVKNINSTLLVKINQFPKNDFIMASYEPFGNNKYIDLSKLINVL